MICTICINMYCAVQAVHIDVVVVYFCFLEKQFWWPHVCKDVNMFNERFFRHRMGCGAVGSWRWREPHKRNELTAARQRRTTFQQKKSMESSKKQIAHDFSSFLQFFCAMDPGFEVPVAPSRRLLNPRWLEWDVACHPGCPWSDTCIDDLSMVIPKVVGSQMSIDVHHDSCGSKWQDQWYCILNLSRKLGNAVEAVGKQDQMLTIYDEQAWIRCETRPWVVDVI